MFHIWGGILGNDKDVFRWKQIKCDEKEPCHCRHVWQTSAQCDDQSLYLYSIFSKVLQCHI